MLGGGLLNPTKKAGDPNSAQSSSREGDPIKRKVLAVTSKNF